MCFIMESNRCIGLFVVRSKKKGEDPKKSFFLFSSPKNSRASCWEEAVLGVFGGGAGPDS